MQTNWEFAKQFKQMTYEELISNFKKDYNFLFECPFIISEYYWDGISNENFNFEEFSEHAKQDSEYNKIILNDSKADSAPRYQTVQYMVDVSINI
jgi:hypothetical protein